MELPASLLALDGQVIYFPVRHHSPAASRLLRELIRNVVPAAVLIEGPSDYNARLDDLLLDHTLPIALYSYVRLPDGTRRSAYYPFCQYSPEWQALVTAREVGIPARFIDLPWADVACDEEADEQRYADGQLRRGEYVEQLCRRAGVDDFDELWDRMIESDPKLTLAEYLSRCHHFCFHVRSRQGLISPAERAREAYMAGQVLEAVADGTAPVLLVTGGFHSSAIHARVQGLPGVGVDEPVEVLLSPLTAGEERGMALTPFSYDRLDSLTGYSAGMPSPGFYDAVWQTLNTPQGYDHTPLLARIIQMLREKKQPAGTADVVALETTARALARLRGRQVVWRNDLLDAVRATLMKEELEYGCESPFLEAVLEVLRGDTQGRLALQAPLPPLLHDIERRLRECRLTPDRKASHIVLDLYQPDDRRLSRTLHQLRLLEVSGFVQTGGTDLTRRDDLSQISEHWRIQWSPEFNASAIEAARYGSTLEEACQERLRERADQLASDAEQVSLLLLDAALAGLDLVRTELTPLLIERIHADGQFLTLVRSLGHLLYLSCYDQVLELRENPELDRLLEENCLRACRLLESLGHDSGHEQSLVEGVRLLVETVERTALRLQLDRQAFVDLFRRVQAEESQMPAIRGAAAGALWSLEEAQEDAIRRTLRGFSNPEAMGDFLNGLFCLAREAAQRHPQLVECIDELLMSLSAEEFTAALPALRLSFTYFSPREKHAMLTTLFHSLGIREAVPLEPLHVSAEAAATALAWEERVWETVETFGLLSDEVRQQLGLPGIEGPQSTEPGATAEEEAATSKSSGQTPQPPVPPRTSRSSRQSPTDPA